ncbi:MAG: AAA family ATPase [Gemmatimonadaceae bacterium]|nr:AAA family ATPase [Gemmatimonadaceae bacterium]
MLLRTLGTVDLRESGSETPVLVLGKPLALLIFLSAAPGRTASRSLLISLLWSDLESDAAKHALRQTIWYIRRKVGRELLAALGDSLQLVPDVAVDRDALLAASSAGEHATVVARYTGPFVPNFATPGGSGFEDWCALERRRLLQVFRHAAEATIAEQLAKGQARAAVDLARRLRDQDPYDENGWRLLLEACTSANDTLAARAEGEALAQFAEREELQLEPATRALLRLARAAPGERHTPDGTSAAPLQAGTLVGRELVFSQLLAAWDEVKEGGRRRIHITGRAGMGKSRLLRDLEARLRAMRAKVAVVGGTYGARDVAFALAGELAAALARLPGRQAVAPATAATLVELNPSLSTWFETAPRVSSLEDQLRARAQAMRELALAVAYEHPIAILIDDLHWADEPSLALLGALADGLGEARVLLVTTGRTEARQVAVASHAETRHITLAPLTAAQVEELVLSIAALPAEGWGSLFAGELWRTSRGSPLLALETLQLLEERGVLQRADGAWRSNAPDALLAELRSGDALRGRLEDLERGDKWLLTLLAAAGAPLDEPTLVAASERPAQEVHDRLRWLESRGVVVAVDDSWRMAHDEIGDEVLRLANVDGIATAATRLGAAMLMRDSNDERQVRRAAQLLRNAGDDASRAEVFRRFARQRFVMGDRRPLRALAVDLFGPTTRERDLHAVVRAAPLSWRLGLVSPLRRGVTALGALLLLAVGAYAMTRRPAVSPPDAVLGLAILDPSGRVTFRQAELREEGWSPLEPLETRPWTVIPPVQLETRHSFDIVKRPGHDEVLITHAVNDSGTIDLFLFGARGFIRRVSSAPGDDGHARFSSNGERLVFNTARWDSLSHYDLALYDFGTGATSALTVGSGSDDTPMWSPSGASIAFSRANWGVRPNELCRLDIALSLLDCRAFAEAEDVAVAGWMDEERVLVYLVEKGREALYVYQWSSSERSLVKDGPAQRYHASPDARWIYCDCEARADGARLRMVFPSQAATLSRPLRLDGVGERSTVYPFWISGQESRESQAQRLTLSGPSIANAGVPTRFRAKLTDARGRELSFLGGLRWTLRDTAGGQIDSLSGELLLNGRREHVTVLARSGNVARDSLTVTLGTPPTAPRLVEDWSDSTLSRWFSFGRPRPSVVAVPGEGWAMLNNGEGSFVSGVLSRAPFDATRGLAVDLRLSGAITRLQWQTISLTLFRTVDTLAYARALGTEVTPSSSDSDALCSVGYGIEGRRQGRMPYVSFVGASTLALAPPDARIFDGAWATIRLQLLPDGRCGVAIDGVPLAIVRSSGPPSTEARVQSDGNSRATRMLVGRMTVYEGVPADIDWRKARTVIP